MGDSTLATETVEGLRGIGSKSPFWAAQQRQLIIQLLDFIHRPEAAPPIDRQRTIVRLLLSVSEVLELKPNFFGVGVNFNKMIEKLARRIERR